MSNEEKGDMKQFDEYLNFVEGTPGELVEGIVTRIDPQEGLVVDFGGKFEGIVPQRELVHSVEEYEQGQKVKLQVMRFDEEEGYVFLSERKPRMKELLTKLQEAYEDNVPVKGRVVQETKGGYRVLLQNMVPAFMPGSHSLIRRDQKPPKDEIDLLILDYKRGRRGFNIVVSKRALQEKRQNEFLAVHKEGDVVKGKVVKVDSNSIHVDLGPVQGVVPRNLISHDPSLLPKDVCSVGSEVEAKIVKIADRSKVITLSMKDLEPDPWQTIRERYPVGTIIEKPIKSILPFGFFVTIEPGVDGLVHISEIVWGRKRVDLHKMFKVGQTVQVEVVEINEQEHRIALSYKKVKGDPWENIEQKYKEENTVTAEVVRVLPSGIIVELEEGVTGFIPKSELSWKRIADHTSLFKEKQQVTAKIISLDAEQRRMRLSVKRTVPNPWNRVSESLRENDEVKATVNSKTKNGYIVTLDDFDVEAFIPSKQASEELLEGSKIEGVVLKIVPELRKIIISQIKLEEKRNLEEYNKKMRDNGGTKTLGDIMRGAMR